GPSKGKKVSGRRSDADRRHPDCYLLQTGKGQGMTQVLLRLLISLAASQWLYLELLLFYPDVDQLARRGFEVIRIPTHDKWEGFEQSTGMNTLVKLFGRRPAVRNQ